MALKTILLIGCSIVASTGQAPAQEDLSALGRWMRYSDAENSLYRHIANLAYEGLDEREARVSMLRTRDDWVSRREEVRAALMRVAGAFPERTPLNARVTGTLQGDGFRVEKVLFESVPGYVVSAAVFVPDGEPGRRPAILYLSGHAAEGFRSATYQTAILNLVQKGFVVLAFDPVGQGERRQYDDPATGESRIGGPTREHSYPGAQIFLAGDSPALYFIWDGMRAIDYLVGRPEVDPERIGVTGRSGGGTQSSYVAAFDERVRAAAPENYLSSLRRIFESVGPQDAEQNFFNGIASGLDHADLILAHAPKPYLLIATTRDMFSIQGVRETGAEAKRAYEALGEPGGFRIVEDDAGHASTRRNREAMYAFFQEALAHPGDPTEVPVAVYRPEELHATETGQLSTSEGSADLFTLNRVRVEASLDRLAAARQEPDHLIRVREAAERLSGYQAPSSDPGAVLVGRFAREGYTVEQHILDGEGDYPIPMLFMLPDGAGPHPAVVVLHPDGKAVDAGPGGSLERLVRRGFVVAAPDLVGTGEVGPGRFRGDAYDYGVGIGAYNLWWGANQVGRSLVGIRAGDVARVVDFLEAREDVHFGRIGGVAHGTMGPVLLHAAAFVEGLAGVAVTGSPASYAGIAVNRYYRPELIHATVPGALIAYDLPDLVATLAPTPVMLLDATDHWGRPLRPEAVLAEYDVASREYPASDSGAELTVGRTAAGEAAMEVVTSWLEGVLGDRP